MISATIGNRPLPGVELQALVAKPTFLLVDGDEFITDLDRTWHCLPIVLLMD